MRRITLSDAPPERDMIAYFGHHKCGSRWIGGLLEGISHQIGLRYYTVYDKLTPHATGPLTVYGGRKPLRPSGNYTPPFDRRELRERVDAVAADIVACPTADRLQADVLRPARAFHVIRDPRDIIVSAYFSHRNSHSTARLPHLQAHRDALRDTSMEQGLLLEMAFSKTELLQIGDWDYTTAVILELRMEEVTRHPYDAFIQIFRHLGLLSDSEPVAAGEQVRIWISRLINRLSHRRLLSHINHKIPATGEIVLGAVYAQRFEAQTMGRERGTEDVTSHYRKGVAGDWVNYFTPRHVEAFNAYFGDLLIRLGYEEKADWIAQTRSRA